MQTCKTGPLVDQTSASAARVDRALRRAPTSEKTLIVFSGDNGTARQSGTFGGRQINGVKDSMCEGGVRDDGWKPNQNGELFDMKDAPFVEQPVAADAQDAQAAAERKRLQAVLDQLNPAAGKVEPEGLKAKPKPKPGRKKKGAVPAV